MPIYLDHNASHPLHPVARTAVVAALDLAGNAASAHAHGRALRQVLDHSRRQVAEAVGVRSEQVVFTSGGTEAANLALKGILAMLPRPTRILVSPVEHACVLVTARAMADTPGVTVEFLRTDAQGNVDVAALADDLLRGDVGLVSVMQANNESGLIQPIAEIAKVCRCRGVLLHVDAVQALGKLPVDFTALGADLLTLSFHKAGGPKGVGALVLRGGVDMVALLHGGGQERNRRAGSENVAAIAGAGALCAELPAIQAAFAATQPWRDATEQAITAACPTVSVVGQGATRLPNTSLLVVPGLEGQMAVMGLDLAGVSVSSGSACSSGKTQPSHVLLAHGYSTAAARCGLRFSWGLSNSAADVPTVVNAFTTLYQRLQPTTVEKAS